MQNARMATSGSSSVCTVNSTNELSDIYTTSYEVSNTVRASSSELSISERLKARCRPQPWRLSWFKCKGAVLVVLLNLLCVNSNGIAFIRLQTDSLEEYTTVRHIVTNVSFVVLYPLAGWIADVYFGRYKVICVSLLLMWTGTIASALAVMLDMLVDASLEPLMYIVFPLSLVAIQCGNAGFVTNGIPFGTDQLTEGSSNHLSAYIHWFVFTSIVSLAIDNFSFLCLFDSSATALLQLFLQCVCLSVALCLNFCFGYGLIMEPRARNPFRTILKVLKYAYKHKEPRFRSAFTYSIQEKPTRLEFCKPLYGGPFTVEQVEDVKTFLRMLLILIPLSLVWSVVFIAYDSVQLLSLHMSSFHGCSVEFPMTAYLFTVSIVMIPFYEFVLYPFVQGFIPSMLVRAGIGAFFICLSLITQLIIDTLGHHLTESLDPEQNATESKGSTCFFSQDAADIDLNYSWITLPGTLCGLGAVFLLVALYEFVFAQSPYNMKGLFMGLLYGLLGIFRLINFALNSPFLHGVIDTTSRFPSCGFWYYLMNIVIAVAALMWLVCASWKYKRREREPPENHQRYTEEFYDKYLGMSRES